MEEDSVDFMTVAVVGSRTMKDQAYVFGVLNDLRWIWDDFIVVSGGAEGADLLAWCWAVEVEGIIPIICPADWDDLSQPDAVIRTRKDGSKYDARAGYRRNREIVDNTDRYVVAFWDGQSSGTRSTIDLALDAGKTVYVFWPGKAPEVLGENEDEDDAEEDETE